MNRFLLFLFFCFVIFSTKGQSRYIGLSDIANVRSSQQQALNGNYWPKLQLIDSSIYVPTKNGIYQKHLRTLLDTNWVNVAFSGISIRDFVKNKNQILAISSNTNDSLMLFSNNNGLSYTFRTDTHFVYPQANNSIHQIAHHSNDFGKVLVSHLFGISLSQDTGKSWTLLSNYSPAYQYRFIDFHPNNSQKLFSTGENGFFSSYLYASFDSGNSWNNINSTHNNCTHVMAFHPTNEIAYLIGGEGRIEKSIDNGNSWVSTPILPYIYVYQIRYDTANPNTVYAAGGINGFNDTIYLLKSIDSGDNWNIVYRESFNGEDTGGILDFLFIEGGIIYLTAKKGIYFLPSRLLSLESQKQKNKPILQLFPNPTSGTVQLKSTQEIQEISLYNQLGQQLKKFTLQTKNFNFSIDNLEEGIYFISILSQGQKTTKKLIKHK